MDETPTRAAPRKRYLTDNQSDSPTVAAPLPSSPSKEQLNSFFHRLREQLKSRKFLTDNDQSEVESVRLRLSSDDQSLPIRSRPNGLQIEGMPRKRKNKEEESTRYSAKLGGAADDSNKGNQ